jgi:sialate O-acetylesterase
MKINKSILFFLLLSTSWQFQAKVVLPDFFSNNMVLQQNSTIKLWGLAKPNRVVQIQPSWLKTMEVKTGNDGKWQLIIATPIADFIPQCIQFNDGEKSTLSNILFGEVWLCSGQSNMEMTFKGFEREFIADAETVLSSVDKEFPLRLFRVKRNSQDAPGTDIDGTWTTCSRDQVERFSAIGYFFGQELSKRLNVPVGIIVSAWGGSRVEGWMSEELVRKHSEDMLNTEYPDGETWKKPEVMYNGMIYPLKDVVIRGVCWYQGESNVDSPETYGNKLSDMMDLWRNIWDNDSLPFLIVEIAPYLYDNGDQSADFRMAQKRLVASEPFCGFVSTGDLVLPEEEKSIHPSNKKEVAKRLVEQAVFLVYGSSDVCVNYPTLERIIRTENEIIIRINSDTEVRSKNGTSSLEGFVARNAAGEVLPMTFAIGPDGKSIIGRGAKLQEISTLSYAYGGFVLGTIQNGCGLPLLVFKEVVP